MHAHAEQLKKSHGGRAAKDPHDAPPFWRQVPCQFSELLPDSGATNLKKVKCGSSLSLSFCPCLVTCPLRMCHWLSRRGQMVCMHLRSGCQRLCWTSGCSHPLSLTRSKPRCAEDALSASCKKGFVYTLTLVARAQLSMPFACLQVEWRSLVVAKGERWDLSFSNSPKTLFVGELRGPCIMLAACGCVPVARSWNCTCQKDGFTCTALATHSQCVGKSSRGWVWNTSLETFCSTSRQMHSALWRACVLLRV